MLEDACIDAHMGPPYEGSSPSKAVGFPESARSESPLEQPAASDRLTVVLDIDETLIHATTCNGTEDTQNGFFLQVGKTKMLIRKRPFLDEFLREASKRFNLVAFTAGSEDYAGPLLDALDPQGRYFQRRLFRHHCLYKYGKHYVKDLGVFNLNLERTVLVDNNPHSFLLQLNNGVPIAPFMDDLSDKALVTLFDFLLALDTIHDVRMLLRDVFGLSAMLGNVSETALTRNRSSNEIYRELEQSVHSS
jgi:Dullard-like phosphatase family protein